MMTPRSYRLHLNALMAALLASLGLAACGGGSGAKTTTPPPPAAITVSLAPAAAQSIDQGQTLSLTATVTNDSSNAGVAWSVSGGGALSGQTISAATYTAPATVSTATAVTVSATAKASSSATASLTITVNPPPAVTTNSLPDATVGAAYSATLQGSGGSGALSWELKTGTLPAGLSLSAKGVISGTPTAAGVASLTVDVSDPAKVVSAAMPLSLTVDAPAPLAISTTTLADATQGTAYSATLAASGGTKPYSWILAPGSGGFGAGLTMSAAGVISGTPTTTGTTTFTVQVSDAENPPVVKPQALTLTVDAAPLAITTATLSAATTGAAYTATLAASGGAKPYSWSLATGSTLPAGLTLSTQGVLSGTPTAAGNSSFTVKVTDSETPSVTKTQDLALAVNVPAALAITTTALAPATEGAAYSATLEATGGTPPYVWRLATGSSLPDGLALSTVGVITGTPATTGTTDFTVQVTDAATPPAVKTQDLALAVNASGVNDSELKGQYALMVGDPSTGAETAIAASVTADGNGAITSGEYDLSGLVGAAQAVAITGGTYAVGADGRGTLEFHDGNANSYTFAIAVGGLSNGVASQGGLTETDGVYLLTGEMEQQDASAFSQAKLSGSFAMGLSGDDSKIATVGSFTVSSTGVVSNGLLDKDNGGTVTSGAFTGAMGTVDASGRGTLTTTDSTGQDTFAFYAVSANQLLLFHTSATLLAAVTGEALRQTGGPYSAASLQGNSVLVGQSNDGAPPLPSVEAGVLTFDGSGTLSAVLDSAEGGTFTQEQPAGIPYSITSAANGRFTIITGDSPLIGYLISPNNAFLFEASDDAELSRIYAQSSITFNAASLKGTFVMSTLPPAAAPVAPGKGGVAYAIQSGVITFDGAGGFETTVDSTTSTGSSSDKSPGTYTIAGNGRFASGDGTSVGYVVSPTFAVIISTNGSGDENPVLLHIKQ